MELKFRLHSLSIAFICIAVIITITTSGPVPFTNCPSAGIFPVDYVDIVDSGNGANCSDGTTTCTLIGGHSYTMEFGGCDTPGYVINVTAKPYNVIANITLGGYDVILLDNVETNRGDLCNHFAPSSSVQSCPLTTPVCCSFRVPFTVPIVSLPIPLPLPGTNGTIYGRAWENVYGANSAAAGCIQVPFNYQLTP